MARSKEKRRARLLAGFVDYLLRNGLSDLSLRPAATALGTSPRILLYYFGSKERLLTAAIAAIRAREDARFQEEIQRGPVDRPIRDVILASWRWFTSPTRDRYLRLFFEIYGLAAARPKQFDGFVRAVGADYYPMMHAGLRMHGFSETDSRLLATRYLGMMRGLMLDLLTTGDRARIDATVEVLAREMERDLLSVGAASSAADEVQDPARVTMRVAPAPRGGHASIPNLFIHEVHNAGTLPEDDVAAGDRPRALVRRRVGEPAEPGAAGVHQRAERRRHEARDRRR